MVKENSSPILKNLTFIDTPGLFSSKTGHSKPTLDVVSACDVFFWFIDINVSLTKDDIKSMIGIGERPVFVIFTFVDKAAPSQLQKAIERISKDTEKAGVNIKGYLKLGKREDIRQQFKKEALSVINNLSNEYEPYVPSMHVLNVAYSLEKFLVKHQNGITSQINELDVERRKLLAEYDNSVRKFEMAIHVMKQKVDIVTSTFKNKCRKTWSCMGNTYSILEKNLDNMVESIKDMERVYDGVESLRLVTYGRDVAKIEFLQNRLKIIDEILLRIEEIKKLFK